LSMSMRPRALSEIPEQTVLVARAAFRQESLAMRVRDELDEVFCDGAMPGQQRARRDNAMLAQVPREHLGQGGQHRPVRPGRPWSADLPTQHGDLVTQHQQLRRLGGIASGEERQPAEHPNHDRVQQTHSHAPDHAPARSNSSSQPVCRVLARYKPDSTPPGFTTQ
jgi:hypothetical protein